MKKTLDQKALIIISYLLFFIVTLLIIKQVCNNNLFSEINFINWDAEHYNYIKNNGYEGFRVAFFPLFPLAWKFLHTGIFGIIIFNGLVFLLSFYFLIKKLEINCTKQILLYLTIPSFIFFYLPYSEALFCLCSVFILLGLKSNKSYLVYLGFYLSILSRPTFTIFIPALLITEFLNNNSEKKYLRIGLYFLVALLGFLSVGVIQYYDTGEWFKFFSAQKEGWGVQLQMPILPISSWGGGLIVRVNAFAFLIGLLCALYLSSLILNLKWVKNQRPPKEVLFSLAYIAGIAFLVLFLKGGNLYSLNRYLFATPYVIVVFNYWLTQNITISNVNLFKILGLVFVFWLLFGSYLHLQEAIKFLLLSIYVTLLFAVKSEKKTMSKYSFLILIILNFTFQIIFYLKFLNKEWVA